MFESLKKSGDGYAPNGNKLTWLPKDHPDVLEYIGKGGIVNEEFTPEELDEQQRINSIAELEASITPRNLRGAALGDSVAIATIQQVEDSIALLRS